MKKKKMNISQYLNAILVISAVVVGVALIIFQFADTGDSTVKVKVKVHVPKLSGIATHGNIAFDRFCVQCHGENAGGSDQGPPLVHNIYNPGHHADASFYLAVKNGVRAHHWRFGDMPSQGSVSKAELSAIIRYVRELQRANGISYKRHSM